MFKKIILPLSVLALLFACKNNEVVKEEVETIENEEIAEFVMEKNGLTLRTNHNATEFTDAALTLLSDSLKKKDSLDLRFEVANYELGAQTSDILSGQCANSGQGQHIHFIWDNEPYKAYYVAEFKQANSKGHHVMLSFLSRSYHMSIKEKSAYVLKEYNDGKAEDNFDENAFHMFYSRPKGEYKEADTKQIMLDFYLINGTLAKDGAYVDATFNDSTTFTLTDWQPYFVEGLPDGENKVKLELKNADGSLVPSPFNPVERTFTLKYAE